MTDFSKKTCPLCMEDYSEILTSQQLKPCQCGYQICVWCWHRIMDTAEKDHTQGFCPACRTPYDKENIVGMIVDLYRLKTQGNMEPKRTQQNSKLKPSEGSIQLIGVKVVERNFVNIFGLPLTLADEDVLQRKEYFGQYGKVLKVSMSRTATGLIKQFPKNTCSVYIRYAKEEEAFRCIQSVNGFILDGKLLRACFGTNKYCHAWLRNGACNYPDCLYLHELGSQEDSFTKDNTMPVHTRVQQITGTSNALQYRSGSVLPPASDAYCSDSSEKTIAKASSTTAAVENSFDHTNETAEEVPWMGITMDEGPGVPVYIGTNCERGSIRQPGNSVPDLEHFRKTPNAEADTAQNGTPGLQSPQMQVDSTSFNSNGNELALASIYLVKLLGEIDRRASTLEPFNLQNDQSRFSFPRHEESNNQAYDNDNTHSRYGQLSRDQDKLGSQNGFASNYSGGYEQFAACPALRSQVFAPPSRLPPPGPGFSSHERADMTSHVASGTRLLDRSSSTLRNAYHAPPPSSNLNNTGGEIEFMNPAILAAGRGRRIHNGMKTADDARLGLLAQRSLAAQQVNGFTGPRNVNNFSPSLSDPYGNSSRPRLMDQTQGTSLSSFTQLPRHASPNPLLSNDNVYSRLEEAKFQRRPGPGDPYNRT